MRSNRAALHGDGRTSWWRRVAAWAAFLPVRHEPEALQPVAEFAVEGGYGFVPVGHRDGDDRRIGERRERARPDIEDAPPWRLVGELDAGQGEQIARELRQFLVADALRALQHVHDFEDDGRRRRREDLQSAQRRQSFTSPSTARKHLAAKAPTATHSRSYRNNAHHHARGTGSACASRVSRQHRRVKVDRPTCRAPTTPAQLGSVPASGRRRASARFTHFLANRASSSSRFSIENDDWSGASTGTFI
jgi:hypothetical protein